MINKVEEKVAENKKTENNLKEKLCSKLINENKNLISKLRFKNFKKNKKKKKAHSSFFFIFLGFKSQF